MRESQLLEICFQMVSKQNSIGLGVEKDIIGIVRQGQLKFKEYQMGNQFCGSYWNMLGIEEMIFDF